MANKQKRDWSEYLVIAILVLAFCFGGFMFAISVGLDGVAKILLLIAVVMGVFALLAKFLPNLVMPLFYVLLIFGLLYALGGISLILNGVGLVIGIPIFGLVLWIIYRIGDRYGWWKKANPYD